MVTRRNTKHRHSFRTTPLRVRRDPPFVAWTMLRQRSSFLIASFAIIAFVTGNMVGQHGWYAFWKAALGSIDDSVITFSGMVPPVASVPDYTKWSSRTSGGEERRFSDVPGTMLVPLPPYIAGTHMHAAASVSDAQATFSVDYMGSYATGGEGEGSHPGVDIRVPEGTPIHSIANGVVTSVRFDDGGFGKLIVVRHPHVPDPSNHASLITVYSVYGHLSQQQVAEGEIVSKGQVIGLSGKTGLASGPHLHFQIDRSTAPWHPYWPFTGKEARDAGLTYLQAIDRGFMQERGYLHTLSPLLLVQENLRAPSIAQGAGAASTVSTPLAGQSAPRVRRTLGDGVNVRLQRRLAQRRQTIVADSGGEPARHEGVVTSLQDAIGIAAPISVIVPTVPSSARASVTVRIESQRTYAARTWLTLRLTLLDAQGDATRDTSVLSSTLYLRTAYGEAEFDPPRVTAADFRDGAAIVKMLPRGGRTVVPLLQPMNVTGQPIKPEG